MQIEIPIKKVSSSVVDSSDPTMYTKYEFEDGTEIHEFFGEYYFFDKTDGKHELIPKNLTEIDEETKQHVEHHLSDYIRFIKIYNDWMTAMPSFQDVPWS